MDAANWLVYGIASIHTSIPNSKIPKLMIVHQPRNVAKVLIEFMLSISFSDPSSFDYLKLNWRFR
jgi:hypothetical protein